MITGDGRPGAPVWRPHGKFKQQAIQDFHFDELLDNFLTSPDAFIHAGFKHRNTLRRATANG
jgi:hypothetical protein